MQDKRLQLTCNCTWPDPILNHLHFLLSSPLKHCASALYSTECHVGLLHMDMCSMITHLLTPIPTICSAPHNHRHSFTLRHQEASLTGGSWQSDNCRALPPDWESWGCDARLSIDARLPSDLTKYAALEACEGTHVKRVHLNSNCMTTPHYEQLEFLVSTPATYRASALFPHHAAWACSI